MTPRQHLAILNELPYVSAQQRHAAWRGRLGTMQTIWKKPVTIALEGPDQWVVIQTTQAATWALVEDWPTEDGPALDRACAVCADVMSGKRNREEARQAFIDAAIEAGIPIKD